MKHWVQDKGNGTQSTLSKHLSLHQIHDATSTTDTLLIHTMSFIIVMEVCYSNTLWPLYCTNHHLS